MDDGICKGKVTPLKDMTILLEQEEEILPGVRVLFAPGHTPGHMVIFFASDGERLLYVGDTVLHPLHLEHPDWLPFLIFCRYRRLVVNNTSLI